MKTPACFMSLIVFMLGMAICTCGAFAEDVILDDFEDQDLSDWVVTYHNANQDVNEANISIVASPQDASYAMQFNNPSGINGNCSHTTVVKTIDLPNPLNSQNANLQLFVGGEGSGTYHVAAVLAYLYDGDNNLGRVGKCITQGSFDYCFSYWDYNIIGSIENYAVNTIPLAEANPSATFDRIKLEFLSRGCYESAWVNVITDNISITTQPPGTIEIITDTVPDGAQDFDYTTTGGLSPATFSLDDDADGTLTDTRTFSNVAPGTYTVEVAPVEGYNTEVLCIDPDNGTTTSGSIATIDLDSEETVSCLFTNTLDITKASAANYEESGDDADPVNTYTGELFFSSKPDLYLGGPMPLYFSRYYASGLKQSGVSGTLGSNWTHNFEWSLVVDGTDALITSDRGRFITFTFNGTSWILTGTKSIPFQFVQSESNYLLYHPEVDLLYTFNSTGALIAISDGKGNSHILTYNGSDLTMVSDGLGRTLAFTYNDGKLTTVSDGTRTVVFAYTEDDLTSCTDAAGHVTSYSYDSGGLMTAKALPGGNTPYSQSYGDSGRIASQTDAFSHTTTFAYDDGSGTTTIIDPLGDTRVHAHNTYGALASSLDQVGDTITRGWDANGRRSSITDNLGQTKSYTYHPESGKVASTTYPDSTTTTNGYTLRTSGGVDCYDLTTIEFPDNTSYGFEHDAVGNISSVTDRDNNTYSFTYNDHGQMLTETTPAGGVTTYTYNADGTKSSITEHFGNTTAFGYDGLMRQTLITYADATTQAFTYDANDNVISIKDERDNTSTFAYDANGNIISASDPLSHTTIFEYDLMDRVASVSDPAGNSTTATYDELGRIKTLTDRNSNSSTFGYDSEGNLVSITDPSGALSTRGYDATEKLTSITDPLANTATFAYDSMGRLSAVSTALGYTTHFTHNAMGKLTSVQDPLGNTQTYSYDIRGLLAGITLPAGISSSYDRNAMGLVTQVTGPTGGQWFWDYDAQGRVVSATDPIGNTATFEYNSRGRISRINFANGTDLLDITYDGVGNITRRLYSDSTDIAYTFDAANHLTSAAGMVFDYDVNGNLVESNGLAIGRDAGGRITSLTLAPGKDITYTYDSRDNVIQVDDWIGGVTSFTYDNAGRLTSITRPNGIVTGYTYDNDDRLTGISESEISTISLVRDAAGNITQATRDVPLSPVITDDSLTLSFDAASQVATFTYDAMGRLISDAVRGYTWDLASRLSGLNEGESSVTFSYDADGNVLSRIDDSGNRQYVWNMALGISSISVVREGSNDLRYYVHTPDGELLYSIEYSNGSRHFYHYDEMGSTLFLTADDGSITNSYAYTPYGGLTNATGSFENPYTYMGRYGVMQEGDGLYRMGCRLYNSATGRFISRDPAAIPDTPMSLNPYLYAENNPLKYVDYDGEQSADASHSGLPSERTVSNIKTATHCSSAIVNKIYGDKAAQLTYKADGLARVNKLNMTFGKKPENVFKAKQIMNKAEDLKGFVKKVDGIAKTVKFSALAYDTYKEGPRPLIEEGAEQLAEKAFGQTAGKVVGVVVEAKKMHEGVKRELGVKTKNENLAVESHVKLLGELERARYVECSISPEIYERIYEQYRGTFDLTHGGASKSGTSNMWIEILKGTKAMLEKTF